MSRRGWDLAWLAWLTGVIGSFAALEAVALRRRCHPTLTRTLRRWLGVNPRTRWGRAAVVGFAAFWAALTVHVGRP